jgi:Cof subfamily protein (haloacid dehalogenase superfamily)
MKTLYLSDLDGTLLRTNERLSPYTIKTINGFVEGGGFFSYATARSLVTASAVTAELNTDFPVICYNGGFIFNNKSKEILVSRFLTMEETDAIAQKMAIHNFTPIVYSFITNVEYFSFIDRDVSVGVRHFLDVRKNDVRRREVQTVDELFRGDVFYFTCIDDYERLFPIHESIKPDNRIHCMLHKDVYTDDWWGEYLPVKATKATAALELKTMLGCDKLVVFGDGINDLPLFSVADECYAMANAVPELKKIATAVIDSNNNDGVAKWLEKR